MKFLVVLSLFLISASSYSQLNPVSWTFTSKKLSDKTYEVHVKATMEKNWHVYSQQQPEDAIAEPTKVQFTKSPLISLEGSTKEVGKLERFHDEKLDITANQYASSVDFVQVVKLKSNAKTSIIGTVRYQTCDDKQCLPPKTVNFSIALK